jgi:hypothetical protein
MRQGRLGRVFLVAAAAVALRLDLLVPHFRTK